MTDTILNPERNRPLTDDEYALLRSWLAFHLAIEYTKDENLERWQPFEANESIIEWLARYGAWRISSPCWFSFRLKRDD